jgi:nicotinamide riboside kinase
MLKKIVIIGPECTGKSTLCEQLAKHYHTIWCPEYAREYLLNHGRKYNYDDLLTIAKGQVYLEEKYSEMVKKSGNKDNGNLITNSINISPGFSDVPSARLLFIDTDMYVMKIWSEFVFGKCHSYISEQIAKSNYDLYLLCNTDLPWVKDELREYPILKHAKSSIKFINTICKPNKHRGQKSAVITKNVYKMLLLQLTPCYRKNRFLRKTNL